MATAGSFDLYTCEVCLENMLDKNPRLLSCHQSFCSDCLLKLTKNGSILCPTCRESTTLPYNDINMQKVNFVLQKVKEHFDKMHASKSLLCQLCRAEPAQLNARNVHSSCVMIAATNTTKCRNLGITKYMNFVRNTQM